MLNEPKLFELVKQKITSEAFDVPILRQVADILFEALSTGTSPSLKEILAKTESVEAGNIIVELAQAGEEKANFQSRLVGALETIQRLQKQRKRGKIKAAQDQTRFLRCFSENTVKENPHNMGMV